LLYKQRHAAVATAYVSTSHHVLMLLMSQVHVWVFFQELSTQFPQILQNSSKLLQRKIKQSQQGRAVWLIARC